MISVRVGMKPSPEEHRSMQKIVALDVAIDSGDFEKMRAARDDLLKRVKPGSSGNRKRLPVEDTVRHLSLPQQKKLIDLLRPAAKGPIVVSHLIMDPTGRPLAKEIRKALADAGWSSPEMGPGDTSGDPVPVGIILIIHDANSPPAHLRDLFAAFSGVDNFRKRSDLRQHRKHSGRNIAPLRISSRYSRSGR
jgi:hypothetical protein